VKWSITKRSHVQGKLPSYSAKRIDPLFANSNSDVSRCRLHNFSWNTNVCALWCELHTI